jgi:predicted transcriptional regulator
MNVTLSLDDELVKRVRRIAAERDTTLTAMVREHLRQVAGEEETSARKQSELAALEGSFRKFRFHVGPRKWRREDLHERS